MRPGQVGSSLDDEAEKSLLAQAHLVGTRNGCIDSGRRVIENPSIDFQAALFNEAHGLSYRFDQAQVCD
jgi:hypothetical protein